MLLCQQISGQSLAPRAPGEGSVPGSSFQPFPTPEKQMPIGSSLSRIQLTASCPALDTPCSPADFSESVPRIATCWGPPGASWSPHFSLLTPEEKEIKGRLYLCKKGHGQRESLWWSRCRTVTSWNTRTGHVPKSLNCPKGILLQEPDRAQCRTNLFIQRVCWQNYIPCQSWLQISLGGKQKYFEYQGGIDLDWFNLSTLTTEIPNRASCFTGMSLNEMLQIDILHLDLQKAFAQVPFQKLLC